jgi:hypothetical protein
MQKWAPVGWLLLLGVAVAGVVGVVPGENTSHGSFRSIDCVNDASSVTRIRRSGRRISRATRRTEAGNLAGARRYAFSLTMHRSPCRIPVVRSSPVQNWARVLLTLAIQLTAAHQQRCRRGGFVIAFKSALQTSFRRHTIRAPGQSRRPAARAGPVRGQGGLAARQNATNERIMGRRSSGGRRGYRG